MAMTPGVTFAEAPTVTVLSVKSCVESSLYWVFSELFVHIVFLAGGMAVTLVPLALIGLDSSIIHIWL